MNEVAAIGVPLLVAFMLGLVASLTYCAWIKTRDRVVLTPHSNLPPLIVVHGIKGSHLLRKGLGGGQLGTGG